MMTMPCDCENHAHTDKSQRTPNGNPSHDYGQRFEQRAIVIVKTPYGDFAVCADCANDCHDLDR
jgi:hypothetical protein